MRRSAPRWLAAALVLAACAHIEAPPGGPEDRTGPQLLTSRPDSLAVVPGWDSPVVLLFDERVSERGVQEAVDVSPRTGTVMVDHRGAQLRVSLRGGWRPGVIYQVTVTPRIQDLFNNRTTRPVSLVFSTGPAIPDTRVAGTVVDPLSGRPEIEVRVEAVRLADSLVYAVPTDSSGAFAFRRIPEGEYRLRAFRDLNRNRALDAFEPRDSADVSLVAGDSARARLAVLMPDSTPPAVASAQLRDGIVELRFDDYLDPARVPPPDSVEVVGPDGAPVAVAAVVVGAPEGGPAPLEPGAPAPADSAQEQEPLPSQVLSVELAEDEVLTGGAEYRIRVRGVRNLVGLTAEVETVFTVPEDAAAAPPAPGVPADTAAAAARPARSPNPNPD